MDRLMIIGSTGLVGSKLAGLSAKHGFQSYNTMNRRTTSLPRVNQLDITDRDATLNLVREIRPNVIVNTAAITNVDYCETHRDEARKINVEGVSNLAEAASEGGSRLIHISTDYVLDETVENYTEDVTHRQLDYTAKITLYSVTIFTQLSSY